MDDSKIKTIPLRGKNGEGLFAIVDAELHDRLMQYKWCVNDDGYVMTHEPGTNRTVRMHHMVAFSYLGIEVDHENGDTLDNRSANLRPVTRRQQMQNRRSFGAVEYKGVTTNATGEPTSSIHYNGRRFGIGTYPSFVAAAIAYDAFADHFYGEYARLNFPDMEPLHPEVAQRLRTPRSQKVGGDRFAYIVESMRKLTHAA